MNLPHVILNHNLQFKIITDDQKKLKKKQDRNKDFCIRGEKA